MTFPVRKLLMASALLALLGGCAGIDNRAVSDADLARRAAVALNVPDHEITVSERSAESQIASSVLHFTATTKAGSTHRCYIDVAYFGMMKSEATCAGGQ